MDFFRNREFFRFFFALLATLITNAFLKAPKTRGNGGNDDQSDADCRRLNVTENFDFARFHGVWYEIFAYPYTLTAGGKCVMSTYAYSLNGKIIIYYKFVDSRGVENKFMGMAEEKSPGILSASVPAFRE